MTYVPCANCGAACGPNHQDAAFDPRLSSTSKLIPCESDKCLCGSPHCACSDTQQCMYTRSYAEQSSSSGVLLEDVVSLHDGGAGVSVIFGCETRETGEIFKQRADGLFGLGNSDASLVNQLVAAGEIDDVFSLCFGVVEGDGVLMLGQSPAAAQIRMQYTPIIPSSSHPFYYNVRLDALSVGGDQLDISSSVFQEGYATVLDSGTTFTYMPTPAFQAFSAAVEAYALQHGLVRVRGPDPQYDDICFGGAPEHTDLRAMAAVFPSLTLHFSPAVTLTLGPLNYLFVHTFNSGKYCLGVFDNGLAGTLLGGITFRNVLVEYDRGNKRIGFGKAACRDLGQRHRPPCASFSVDGGNGLAELVARADGDCQPEDDGGDAFDDDSNSNSGGGGEDYDYDVLYGGGGGGDEEHEVVMPTDQQQSLDSSRSGSGSGGDDVDAEEEIVGAVGGDGGEDGISRASGSQTGASTIFENDSSDDNDDDGQTRDYLDDDGSSSTEGEVLYDADDTNESAALAAATTGVGAPSETTMSSSSSSADEDLFHHAPPLIIGLLAGTVAMLSSALVVVLFRPGPREALRSIIPGLRGYRSLDDDTDPESGGGGGGGGGSAAKLMNNRDGDGDTTISTTTTTTTNVTATKKSVSPAAKNDTTPTFPPPSLTSSTKLNGSSGAAAVPLLIARTSTDATSHSNTTINTTTNSGATTPTLGSGGGGSGVWASLKSSSKQQQQQQQQQSLLPSIAVISMTELSNKSPTHHQYHHHHGGIMGLTTPQKLQRTNSNSQAAAVAAMAEELAAMQQQQQTPRAGAGGAFSSSGQVAVPSLPAATRMGPSRGPSTPTRLQF